MPRYRIMTVSAGIRMGPKLQLAETMENSQMPLVDSDFLPPAFNVLKTVIDKMLCADL